MQARHIDHINLRIPTDGAADAREFYVEKLGFDIEDALYAADDKPFFDVRLSETAVIHLWPTESFEAPTKTNYNHVAVIVEESVDKIKTELADVGVEVEKTLDSPLGATGKAGAVYVRDPFGYRVELKSRM
ncbi:VOC family protein [Halorubrum sp. AJ67]|uniref:VOC family protein n=1 Tax=Halorubrum sp. AJ67 TaxID=1173487 RepID=UPI0003DBCB70|nr:VOC family protein [Halorubrum sp. AJ67]CDK39218.1 glyoxalase/bleomycin resistance protein/dioxygenase [Halorubrum sp. AJ67]